MKKYLILAFLVGAAGTASAQTGFTTPVNRQNKTPVQRQVVEPTRPTPVGAFPRAARGNPLQLLNPRAPAKYYGPPQETVVSAPYGLAGYQRAREEPQYSGLILFGLRW